MIQPFKDILRNIKNCAAGNENMTYGRSEKAALSNNRWPTACCLTAALLTTNFGGHRDYYEAAKKQRSYNKGSVA